MSNHNLMYMMKVLALNLILLEPHKCVEPFVKILLLSCKGDYSVFENTMCGKNLEQEKIGIFG